MSKKGPLPFVVPSLDALDALGEGDPPCDTLVLCMTTDTRPLVGAAGYADWRLCGRISRLVERGVVTGAPDEKVLVSSEGMLPMTRLLLYGFGPRERATTDARERLVRLVDVLTGLKARAIALDLPPPGAPFMPLVDDCLKKPLGDALRVVFAPEEDAPHLV